MLAKQLRAAALIALMGSPVLAGEEGVIRFRVVNASSHTIHAVYACSSRESKWGPNLLKKPTLQPGQKAVLHLRGGCGVFDLRFVAEKGTEFMEDEVEFCDDDDVVTIGGRKGDALTRVKAGPAGRRQTRPQAARQERHPWPNH